MIRSELKGLYDPLALELAKEAVIAGNYSLERPISGVPFSSTFWFTRSPTAQWCFLSLISTGQAATKCSTAAAHAFWS